MTKLHATPKGNLGRCVAEFRCPYGGAVAQTLSRGGGRMSAADLDLPIGTTGQTSRGGALNSFEAIISDSKVSPDIIRSVHIAHGHYNRANNPVPREATAVLDTDIETWNSMDIDERSKHLRSELEKVDRFLRPADSDYSQLQTLKIDVEDASLTTIDTAPDENGTPQLVAGRAFLKNAPLDTVWTALCHAYGNLTTRKRGGKYNATWRHVMKRAGVAIDLGYEVSPKEAFPIIAVCHTCKTGSYRPDESKPHCPNCKKQSIDSKVKFTTNPDYAG